MPAHGGGYILESHRLPSSSIEDLHRFSSFDTRFGSLCDQAHASQPSLNHSMSTHADSTPSSVCRPDFSDCAKEPSLSSCATSLHSEIQASYDDNSDIDGLIEPSTKPSLKFVEPVVHRDHQSQRLTGMKRKAQKKQLSSTASGKVGTVAHVPVLGFDHCEGLDEDATLDFPLVPYRGPHSNLKGNKHEQWNIDAIDIALEDITLSSKARPLHQEVELVSASRQEQQDNQRAIRVKGATAHSLQEETEEDNGRSQATLRLNSTSTAHTQHPRMVYAAQVLPQHNHCDDHPLSVHASEPVEEPREKSLGNHQSLAPHEMSRFRSLPMAPSNSGHSAENVFAFSPPSMSDHGLDAEVRTTRQDSLRNVARPRQGSGSVASSQHSSLRDIEPRDLIQRVKSRPVQCGLEAELSDGPDCDDEQAPGKGVSQIHAEDLPPLISTHYLQGTDIGREEYERLTRLPERMQAVAAATNSSKMSKRQLSKSRETAFPSYEPISILRAEAAFLKEEPSKYRQSSKESKKKGRPMQMSASSSNRSIGSSSTRSKSTSFSSGSSFRANSSTSDISSIHESQHSHDPVKERGFSLKSFKSSMRLKQ